MLFYVKFVSLFHFRVTIFIILMKLTSKWSSYKDRITVSGVGDVLDSRHPKGEGGKNSSLWNDWIKGGEFAPVCNSPSNAQLQPSFRRVALGSGQGLSSLRAPPALWPPTSTSFPFPIDECVRSEPEKKCYCKWVIQYLSIAVVWLPFSCQNIHTDLNPPPISNWNKHTKSTEKVFRKICIRYNYVSFNLLALNGKNRGIIMSLLITLMN